MLNDINTGWDYSDLVKMAKLNDGPQGLLDKVRMEGFRQGATTATLVSITILGVTTFVCVEGPKVVKFFKDRKATKQKNIDVKLYPEEYLITPIRVIDDENDDIFENDCFE